MVRKHIAVIFAAILAVSLSGCNLAIRRHNSIPLYVNENARDLVKIVNRYRERHGLPDLQWDYNLYFVCLGHSQDMRERNYFSHYSPEYISPFDRLHYARIEYLYAGENLAHGQMTPDKVFSDWLRSPAHKRNIESVLYTHHAIAYDPEGNYWTHMFISYGSDYQYAISGFRSLRYIRHRTVL